MTEFINKGHGVIGYRCKKCDSIRRAKLDKKNRQKQFDDLVKRFGSSCMICDKPAEVIDHCHSTGQVRGILCKNCNHGIGKLGDDSGSIKRALNYLESNHNCGLYWLRGKRRSNPKI